MTLDEIFPNGRGEGDGRKFRKNDWASLESYFEPFFRTTQGSWFGLNHKGDNMGYSGNLEGWTEWHPPKKTKKIKMYRAIYKTTNGEYYVHYWMSKKIHDPVLPVVNDVVGWQEMEVEIDEDI